MGDCVDISLGLEVLSITTLMPLGGTNDIPQCICQTDGK